MIRKTVLCTKLKSPAPTCMRWLQAPEFLQKTARAASLAGLGRNEDPKEGAKLFSVQNSNNGVLTGFCLCISALRNENGTEACNLCRGNITKEQEKGKHKKRDMQILKI